MLLSSQEQLQSEPCSQSDSRKPYLTELKEEQAKLENQENEIDEYLDYLKREMHSMSKDPFYADYAYLTFEDIRASL